MEGRGYPFVSLHRPGRQATIRGAYHDYEVAEIAHDLLLLIHMYYCIVDVFCSVLYNAVYIYIRCKGIMLFICE